MVEKDPSPGEPVPDRILNEEKDGALKNIESAQEIFTPHVMVTPHVIITPHVPNPSREVILIWITRSLHDQDQDKEEEEREKRERIITILVTIANSKVGGLICDHILKYGATTISELEYSIPTTRASASRTLNRLQICGVVEKLGYVRSPYRLIKTPGPRILIYSLTGADPQASIEAQKRYAAIQLRQEPERREKVARDREAESRKIDKKGRREENLIRVLEIIKPPITQLGPLYDVLNRLEIVDPEERAMIRSYFVNESTENALAM